MPKIALVARALPWTKLTGFQRYPVPLTASPQETTPPVRIVGLKPQSTAPNCNFWL